MTFRGGWWRRLLGAACCLHASCFAPWECLQQLGGQALSDPFLRQLLAPAEGVTCSVAGISYAMYHCAATMLVPVASLNMYAYEVFVGILFDTRLGEMHRLDLLPVLALYFVSITSPDSLLDELVCISLTFACLCIRRC